MNSIVSLFTPSNNSDWLPEIYNCLLEQTDQNWEWIIVYNNGAIPISDLWDNDSRVKTFNLYQTQEWIGPLKAKACEYATGDILLEMDHDDLLTIDAIAEVKKAFEDPDVGFVYSNTIRVDGYLNIHQRFNECYGWKYRKTEFRGKILDECIAFESIPASISKIWYAPDHLRAFRRNVYELVGGYAKDMRVLDDHDLMCRLYCITKFKHIDKALYVYRIHGENAWLKNNSEIQCNVLRLYDKYIECLAEKWAHDQGIRLIEMGGRLNAKAGYETVDLRDADIITDLNSRWPFDDNSIGCIRAFDVFEHLKTPIHTMMELYRVLVPGGYAFIQVPSSEGNGAFSDPTHVSFWNELSFKYYTTKQKNQYIDCPVRFQALRLYTTEKNEEGVCWVVAHLIKLGQGLVPGEVLI